MSEENPRADRPSAVATMPRPLELSASAWALNRPAAPLEAVAVAPWARTVRGGLPTWRLKRVLAYIDDNLGGDISLADLASIARLSPHHFGELFRQSTGTSPYRYVLDRRIECAKVLLRESMLGVLDVALAVGFSDQSHFSKVFRRSVGMAPGAYRQAA